MTKPPVIKTVRLTPPGRGAVATLLVEGPGAADAVDRHFQPAGGKPLGKKDLGLIAMSYGTVYVASIAMGAKDEHSLKAFLEAEAYEGPSLVIAYSHCIAHGINMTKGMSHQKAVVDANQWLLYRYNPTRQAEGLNPLQLDSSAARKKVGEYLQTENRFKMLTKSRPDAAKQLFEQAQKDIDARWQLYSYLASREFASNGNGGSEQSTPTPASAS